MSDNDYRWAVARLNSLRSMRAENLRDGYGVSDIRCYSIDHQTLPMQCLEGLVFTPTIKDVLVKYVEGMGSVLLSLRKIFENLTQLAAQHVQSMITWQRVLGPKSRKPWPEQIRPI